ncbi:hypothetical protein J7K27_04680 [Candidatus Bathyarchaeota archaeon]|nr:hypothetical protein [Candidatus Bathyarchaeota archaeon]
MKRTLTAVMLIGIVAFLAGAGLYAYFSNTAESTDNMFTAGMLDLKISDGGQSWADGITTAEWTMTNMVPGSSTTEWGKVSLKNVGSIAAHHVEISCYYTVTEGEPIGDPDNVDTSTDPDSFAKYIEIIEIKYYNDEWIITINKDGYSVEGSLPSGYPISEDDWKISDTDGVDGISLCDLKYDPLDNLPPPGTNGFGITHFEMTVKFRSDAGNDLQGDTLNLTMIFTLNQDSSQ